MSEAQTIIRQVRNLGDEARTGYSVYTIAAAILTLLWKPTWLVLAFIYKTVTAPYRQDQMLALMNELKDLWHRNMWIAREALSQRLCFEADAAGNFLWCSDAMCELLHLSLADCLHEGWTLAINPLERASVLDEWRDCCRSKSPFSAEVGLRHAGRFEMIARTMPDDRGQVKGYFGELKPLAAGTPRTGV